MPNYFPENDTALPTDSSERSMAKVVSQLPAALDVIGLEPETAVYVARSGATDVAAIDAFVKGVKELGLWNNMVCWPLRRSQNSGGVNPNSNIVYSLGGLGTFDGTRVNGPTWGADGLTFGSTKYVTLPDGAFGTGVAATLIWAVYKNASGANRMFVLRTGALTTTDSMFLESPQFFAQRRVGIAFTNGPTSTFNTTDFVSTLVGNTTNGFGGYNGGSVTEFSLSNVLNKSGTSTSLSSSAESFDGTISVAMRFDVTPTSALNSQIHNLYKSTLGTGLGLP